MSGAGQSADFGSLNDHLRKLDPAENLARSLASSAADDELRAAFKSQMQSGVNGGEAINVLESAGPISDAYIQSTAPISLITGPGGSGKTTASVKKALFETARIYPGSNGVRRYILGVWRQKYDNLWSATIPSWWKILPQDLPGSKWTGAKPRAAEHVVPFEDPWGPCELVARFRAFGESMDPEDLLGNESTDAYLNEMSTFQEMLMIALVDRVGRDPPRAVIRRAGRIFGDANAPDVLNYCYPLFYEAPRSTGAGIWAAPNGYTLFRQPGGLDPAAENIKAMGREYWENSARVNAHRKWWVKRMVHARPGFTRDNDPVYDEWDDERNLSDVTLEPTKHLPVVIGIDGGYTPSAIYTQVIGRQARILGEVVIERGGMDALGEAMLEYEARRFPVRSGEPGSFEFADFCDPSMLAGEDIEGEKSSRQKLSEKLGREVISAPTNDFSRRRDAVRDYLGRTLDQGRPGLILDPSCLALRRGFNQTFHFARTRGTNDISRVEKTPDSHPHDGLQYAALAWGTDAASKRNSDIQRARQQRREEARSQGRRNPLARYAR